MFFRPFLLLVAVSIAAITSQNTKQREQQCAQEISPKIFLEADFMLKYAVYRALVAQMAGQSIEMERIIRNLDRKRQERIYDYYLTGPCEPYKIVMKAHENMTLPDPIKAITAYQTSRPIVGVSKQSNNASHNRAQ